MIIKRKPPIFLVLLVVCTFLFQSCMTIVTRRSQKIPVTGSPTGATISVDGEVIGNIPLILKLKKNKNHVIRIEKEGHNPFVVEVNRESSASSVGLIFVGSLGVAALAVLAFGLIQHFSDYSMSDATTILGFFASIIGGYAAGVITDFSTGAQYTLTPTKFNVTLTKIGQKPRTDVIFIDAEKFQGVRWIRVKCDDSDGEDEIVNLDYSD